MNDEELDIFFIETLNKILDDMKDNAEYLKNETSEELKEIKEDLSEQIKKLTELLQKIHSIDDLALEDDDTITDVYEYLSFYADNVTVRSTKKERKEDFKYCSALDQLLYLFVDDDEEEPEEENL